MPDKFRHFFNLVFRYSTKYVKLHLVNKTDRQKLSTYMKALGHPVRVQIIEILARDGQCISGDLSSQLPVAASTTSQHLAILKNAGLISGTVDGPRRCYCVNKQVIELAKKLLGSLHGCC